MNNKQTETPWVAGKTVCNDGHIVYVPIYSGKTYIASISTYGKVVDKKGNETGLAGRRYTDKLGTERITRVVTDGRAEANARFIVKACNNHDALVEALRDIYDYANTSPDMTPTSTQMIMAKCWLVLCNIEEK